jgi:hypothetical protein
MSRDLPAFPNLDHLKKQAKVLLRELRRRTRSAKLADAQQAIAREYGFANWSKLKAHVESLPSTERRAPTLDTVPSHGGSGTGGRGGAGGAIDGPPNNHDKAPHAFGMFDRYTEQARRVLFFARYEASQLGSTSIESEHLLLAFIREGKGLPSRIFAESRMSVENIRKEVEGRTVVREKISTSAEIPFSIETKQVLQLAAVESDRLRHSYIGIEHLLIGILRQEGSVAASVLIEQGLRPDAVRDEIIRLLNEEAT